MKNFYLDEELIASQIEHLYSFCRSFVYFRAISARKIPVTHANKTYFTHIANVSALNSIIQFCNIFNMNPNMCKIHWTKIAPKNGIDIDGNEVDNSSFHVTVYEILKNSVGKSNKKYKAYIKSMSNFRNKYAAHYDVNEIPEMPFLDNAFSIANAYLTWLRDEIPWNGDPQKNLAEIKPSFEAEIAAVLPAAPAQQ